MKTKVIIRFKSGFELPITCDKFSIRTNAMTGEISSYDIKGIKDNKLLFFRPEDIECIFQDMNDDIEPERKKGKWNFIGDQMFECTECGTCYTQGQFHQMRVRITDSEFPKFCPNCGADMRGEGNEINRR